MGDIGSCCDQPVLTSERDKTAYPVICERKYLFTVTTYVTLEKHAMRFENTEKGHLIW